MSLRHKVYKVTQNVDNLDSNLDVRAIHESSQSEVFLKTCVFVFV